MLVQIASIGVLITGPAGSGKSALALELLTRGHRLIADDAVELRKSPSQKLVGRCPAVLHGFLEVRGLGVLDLRRHFGADALRRQSAIDLIVALAPRATAGRRLTGSRRVQRLLGVPLPRIALRPGHNLAVRIEAAARAEQLRRAGFDAAADLARRQHNAIQRNR